MLNTAQTAPFYLQKLLPGTFEWSYGSKTEFFPIFGPVVTSPLDLWNPKSNQFIVISQLTQFEEILFMHS